MRIFDTPTSRAPEVHLLSNGRYHMAISNSGGGYSRWRDLAVTRWREDATRDCWGAFVYLRDKASGRILVRTYQPTLRPPEHYEVIFAGGNRRVSPAPRRPGDPHRNLRFAGRRRRVAARDPNEPFERRALNRTNELRRSCSRSSWGRCAHPVFSNLFVQTEFVRENSAILCTRRPRSEGEMRPVALAFDGGRRRRQGRSLLRNGPRKIYRARSYADQPGGNAGSFSSF